MLCWRKNIVRYTLFSIESKSGVLILTLSWRQSFKMLYNINTLIVAWKLVWCYSINFPWSDEVWLYNYQHLFGMRWNIIQCSNILKFFRKNNFCTGIQVSWWEILKVTLHRPQLIRLNLLSNIHCLKYQQIRSN